MVMMMNPGLRPAVRPIRNSAAVTTAAIIPQTKPPANPVMWKRVAPIATAYAPTPKRAAG